jgi:hypothetical protein
VRYGENTGSEFSACSRNDKNPPGVNRAGDGLGEGAASGAGERSRLGRQGGSSGAGSGGNAGSGACEPLRTPRGAQERQRAVEEGQFVDGEERVRNLDKT